MRLGYHIGTSKFEVDGILAISNKFSRTAVFGTKAHVPGFLNGRILAVLNEPGSRGIFGTTTLAAWLAATAGQLEFHKWIHGRPAVPRTRLRVPVRPVEGISTFSNEGSSVALFR